MGTGQHRAWRVHWQEGRMRSGLGWWQRMQIRLSDCGTKADVGCWKPLFIVTGEMMSSTAGSECINSGVQQWNSTYS
eukprot:scaffold121622_cov79-Cyclotella_meneghiniana.AAC.2